MAAVPLNLTILFAAVAEKLSPKMVTLMPLSPVVGEKLSSFKVAAPGGEVTVKVSGEVAVWLSTSTVTFPVAAPAGTVTVKLVAEAADTAAVVPLNFTRLLAGTVEKLVPTTVTIVPTIPEAGEILLTVGALGAGFAGSSFSLQDSERKDNNRLSIKTSNRFFIEKELARRAVNYADNVAHYA
jgi:hypothetical protein